MIGKRLKSFIDPALEVLVLYQEAAAYWCAVYVMGRYYEVKRFDEGLLCEMFR